MLVMGQVFRCTEMLFRYSAVRLVGRLFGGKGGDLVNHKSIPLPLFLSHSLHIYIMMAVTDYVFCVLGPILGEIYCAIHGGDMCAVRRSGNFI